MTRRAAPQWTAILLACGVLGSVAAAWGPVFADEINDGTFSKGDADIIDWLPQILHESRGLQRMEEDLNYSASRIVQVWPSRFRSIVEAMPYANNPKALANQVYGGRMGNSRTDDGWTYRGRSPIGITGLANYQRVGDLMGQDLVGIPDLLCQPRFALDACIAWWEDKIPDSMLGETTNIRQRVNGGVIGLGDVQRLKRLVQGAMSA
ncbi:glycoside hydrolase family 19 protein [Variovorax ginsengisoli]|uniref:Glycoside hydrolase family 19 protein n=1 Tax=Variovorax ginsengisoli TaxID=363844 RepID=A0ABT8SDQ7_9BURK|nr:glycoside hydrolase family 19 protein [Variovorax ginsengisoli]MDN8617886.1 glycoside hydrolase family 19 protein [Variovorax ginsengisoli]MDO1537056.1 glycoside hydrolase family 19 protein [Variovorax ginsengisoli]